MRIMKLQLVYKLFTNKKDKFEIIVFEKDMNYYFTYYSIAGIKSHNFCSN